MSLTRTKLAEVLDALADYVEEIELQKHAAEQSQRTLRIDKFAARYEQSTGEAVPVAVRKKLASLDPDALDHIMRTVHTASEAPEMLGNPAEISADSRPMTVKEAAQQAEDQFQAWLTS